MKKGKIFIIVGVVVLLLVCGFIYFNNNQKYSYEWIKVEDSAIGQYKLYVNNSFGKHIDGTVRLVFINGKTKKVNIDKEGTLFIKDVVSDVRNPMKR